MAHHQRRPLHPCDDVRHREGFTAAGDAEQSLFIIAFLQTIHQFVHRLRLVAGHLEIGY